MRDSDEDGDLPAYAALHKIWVRTRVRSYAHHFASERIRRQALLAFRQELKVSVIGLSFLIAGLSLSEPRLIDVGVSLTGSDLTRNLCHFASHLLIVASVFMSVWALFLAVVSKADEGIAMQGRHKLMSRLYMSMSQKTRRIEANVYDGAYYDHLVASLNDQLDSVLTAGESPEDEDYRKAHTRMTNVLKEQTPGVRSSFVPGAEPRELEQYIEHEIEQRVDDPTECKPRSRWWRFRLIRPKD